MMTDRELTIVRVFDAPRELVFRAWIDPEQFASWLGPKGCRASSVTLDVTPGGAWRTCVRNEADGSEYWSRGVYREIAEPERLVFTYAWEEADGLGNETLVTVTFAERGGKTEMTFHQAEFVSVEDRNGHRGGWSEAFDRFVIYLKVHNEH